VAVTVMVDPDTDVVAIPAPLTVIVPPKSTEPLPALPAKDTPSCSRSVLLISPAGRLTVPELIVNPLFPVINPSAVNVPSVTTFPVLANTWKVADAVESPPTARSSVVLYGANTSSFNCQKFVPSVEAS